MPPPALALDDPAIPVSTPATGSCRRAPCRRPSASDAVRRLFPYYEDAIVPELLEGRTPIVVAHGNSLRALVKYLEDVSDQDIVRLNIATGIPRHYDPQRDLSVKEVRHLGDAIVAEAAADRVEQAGRRRTGIRDNAVPYAASLEACTCKKAAASFLLTAERPLYRAVEAGTVPRGDHGFDAPSS